MTWSDFLVLAVGLLLLCTSVITVLLRRRAELSDERQLAQVLERVASTVDQLHSEVASRIQPGPAGPHRDARARMLALQLLVEPGGHSATAAGDDHCEVLKHIVHDRGASSLGHRGDFSSSANVVHMWEHLTRATEENQSYRALLGPAFEDAVYHAANVGVVNRDQAEALVFWAKSTAPISRHSRSKVQSTAHPRGSRAAALGASAV